MSYTFKDYERDRFRQYLHSLTREEILEKFPIDEIVKAIPVEEILNRIPKEELLKDVLRRIPEEKYVKRVMVQILLREISLGEVSAEKFLMMIPIQDLVKYASQVNNEALRETVKILNESGFVKTD